MTSHSELPAAMIPKYSARGSEVHEEAQSLDATSILLGLLLAGVVLISLVAIIGGFLHYKRERLLTHQERMKALEFGRELPDDPATARTKALFGDSSSGAGSEGGESLPRKMITTVLWVAFWGFLFGGPAGAANHGVAIAMAAAVGAIGVAAMICGTILAIRLPASQSTSSISKPEFDSDAFDVVSRRG